MRSDSPHNLEAFLQSQKAAGSARESGKFTLHREKALQKIAEYTLPYNDAWALLVAQAATLWSAPELKIQQLSKETHFSFTPQFTETVDFENLFFDPSPVVDPALQTLRSALWGLGVGQKRPFQITLPHQSQSYLWDGFCFVTQPARRSPRLELTVSIRTFDQGKGLPLIRSIEAAVYNKRVSECLVNCLYTMPMSVSLDGRTLDGYSNSPTHGNGHLRNPLRFMGFRTEGATFPAGRQEFPVVYLQDKQLQPLSQEFQRSDFNSEHSVKALLTAHGGYTKSGKNSTWQSKPTHSQLCWVRNGVIIQREQVSGPSLSVSLAVHICADDMRTDITGFALQEADAAGRRKEALRLVAERLQEVEIDFHVYDETWSKGKKALTAAAVVGGAGLKLLAGPVGLPFLFMGVASGFNLLQGIEMLCRQFRLDLEKLQNSWRQFL